MAGYLQQAVAAQKAAAKAAAAAKAKKGGGLHLPNLGVSNLIDEVGQIPTGLARLGTSLLPGGEKAGDVWGGFAKGTSSSLASTVMSAVDIATAGQAHALTDPIRRAAAFGDDRYASDDIFGQIKKRGLLPAIVENVGNVALLGGAGAALTGLSEAGRLATAGRLAEEAGAAGIAPEVISQAADAAGGSRFGRAARFAEADIPAEARPAGIAASKAVGATATPEDVAAAGKTLDRLETVAHPYHSIFDKAIRPLGKAATLRSLAEDGALPVGPEAPAAEAAAGVEQAPPVVGPVEERLRAEQAKPVPQWAQDAVSRLPKPVAEAGAKVDRFINARRTSQVLRERLRMQDVDRRTLLRSDEIAKPRKLAEGEIVGRTLPDGTRVTPAVADVMLGDEIIARSDLTKQLEDTVAKAHPEAADAVRETFQKIGARSESPIPQDWLVDPDGNPTELSRQIDDAVQGARKLSEDRRATLESTSQGDKGLEQADARTPELSKKSQRLSKEAEKARAKADKLEEKAVPREAARHERLADLIQKRIDSTDEASARAAARGDEAAVNFDATRAPEEAQLPVVGRSEAQRAQSLLPGAEDVTKHGVYREGIKGGRSLEQIRNEAAKAAELDRRKVSLQRNLDSMKATLEDKQLPSQLEAERLRGRATKLEGKVADQLNEPSLRAVPAKWKPVWNAIESLHKEAETNPMLAGALEEIPKTWETVLKLAEDNGFDPTHIASLQPTDVQRLVGGVVSLGNKSRDLGQTITSGQRKLRLGAQARTRSLSALAAASVDATRELHTNALSKFIDDTYARPVVDGVIPHGYVGWDDERSFLLNGERQADNTVKVEGLGAPTKMIPREVKTVLDNYQKDYSHGVFSSIRKAIDPWRLFMLSLSPRWYVNNFAGNLMLATKEGVRLQDWVKAWKSYRAGGVDEAASAFQRTLGPGADAFSGPEAGAIDAGFFTSEDKGTLVSYPKGIEGLKLAQTVSNREALGQIQHAMGRGNQAVDDMARVATYFSGVRHGLSDAKALQRSYEALINFNDLSPFEREVVRTAVPFYAWQKGILKLVAKFPIDNPQVAGIMLSFAQIQQELTRQHFGGDLPDYYKSVIDLPGLGPTQLRGINPFQDAKSLTTPQGIAGSLNPVVSSYARNALGAPDGGFADTNRVNEFGSVVPDTSPFKDLLSTIKGAPQANLGASIAGTSLTGAPKKSVGQALGSFVGVPRYTQAQVQAMVKRQATSEARIRGQKTGSTTKKAKRKKTASAFAFQGAGSKK